MRTFLLLITLIIVGNLVYGQNKKPLTIDNLQSWNHLQHQQISSSGQFVAYEVNPYKGDGELRLWNAETNKTTTFKRGYKASFAYTNDYLAFLVKPQHDSLRAAKLAKVKKENLPKDSLFIYTMENQEIERFEKVESMKMPRKGGNFMAWSYKPTEEEDIPADSTIADSAQEEKKSKEKKKIFDKSAPKSNSLAVYNPISGVRYSFDNVTEFEFSENGATLMCIILQNDTILKSSVVKFDTQKNEADTIFEQAGLAEKITINKDGSQWAFMHSADSIKEKIYSLYAWSKNEHRVIADTLTEELPTKWTVSKNGKLYFTDNGERLYFGAASAPQPEPEDTLLPSEKVHLDLWSWTDGKLQPEQLAEKKREEEKSYLSYWDVKNEHIVMVEDTVIKAARVSLEGEGQFAIGYNYTPYEKRGSWEMPYFKDVYKIDMENNEKKLIIKETQYPTQLSNSGNYISYYSYTDSNWYVYDMQKEEFRNLTKNIDVDFYQQEHDYPNDADPYYYAGWTKNDDYFLVYDEFDVWQIDPTGKKAPHNLTQGYGRENNIRFRYIKLDSEAKFINPKEALYLHAFNKTTKAWGYYRTEINSSKAPEKVMMQDYRIYYPKKAELADKIIWKKSSFEDYPEVWYSNLDVNDPVKVSETNPQQKEYNWGTVEMVKWITSEGTEEEGLLYKPENFDPNKKYPMMVYFYRLYSDDIHRHYTPKPSRSVINFSYYVSNEYLLFIPNIRYKKGYPGESAVNYVVSGTTALLNKHDYIDKDRVGLQGQSWGGYQVAYIITETNLYAAASAGAPVTNMTSAYGGIRWKSGMSRMFQYEETQSRIGGTLWEKPLQYIENSPVFFAPKVNTPLLMRHNDNDGAVPWYQGIEYFTALRRLNKPVWLLNYNGGPHNEKAKSPNSVDLSIRMMQFFNHYLKGEPAPKWMTEGIPAIEKGKTMKYELNK